MSRKVLAIGLIIGLVFLSATAVFMTPREGQKSEPRLEISIKPDQKNVSGIGEYLSGKVEVKNTGKATAHEIKMKVEGLNNSKDILSLEDLEEGESVKKDFRLMALSENGTYEVKVKGTCREKITASNSVQIKVEELKTDFSGNFIKGADISLLRRLENLGATYSDGGDVKDPLEIFEDHGFNYMRLRLFHSPTGKTPVVNNLKYTIKLAKRIKRENLKLLLDFHYSDTWADPGKQYKPEAWENLSFENLKKHVFNYTKNVISTMKRENVLPDIVQIGNEINNGMLWPEGKLGGENQWQRLGELIKSGIRGVNSCLDSENKVRIMIHSATGGSKSKSKWFYNNLLNEGVEFDIIGISFYPWWHGTLRDLKNNLNFLSNEYKKDIIVVETAYPWKNGESYFTESEPPYPVIPYGQKAFLRRLIHTVKNTPKERGIGVFYWAPELVDVKNWSSPNQSRALFHENGEILPGITAFEK